MRDIERYMNIQSAHGASLSQRGTLAFLMDTTQSPQVWTLDSPQAWPEQRTFTDERVTFCSFSPTREELVFGMDAGGNERQQLYLLDLDSESASQGSVTNLTRTPDAKHMWGGWSHDGERFAFASNRRDTAVFDIYVQRRDETGEEGTRVCESEGLFLAGEFSPNDERLFVSESHSSFDQDLYVLDLSDGNGEGDLTHLTPHEGNVRYRSPTWGPNGEIYIVTDHRMDTMYLARLQDDGSGDLTTIEEGGDWNVSGISIDEETRRIAYSRNVEGYTEFTVGVIDGTITNRTLLDHPDGVAGGVSFSGDRLAFTTSGRTANSNVSVAQRDSDGWVSTQWTNASTAGIPPISFIEPDLIRYETFDGREIPAFFSLPENAGRGKNETPVIVDIHGGPEGQRRPSFSALTQYFLAHGYAVFEPNVRGSTGYGNAYTHLDDVEKRMDSVTDLRAGVEWLCDRPTVDPDRIVAKGGSYGGFMVLGALTEQPDIWAAGVDIVGIANFVTFLENTGEWRREHREAEYGSLENDRKFLESISPINNVEAIRSALFVLHGANDPRVPVGEAEQIAAEADDVELLVFEDEGHGITKRENRIEAYERIVDFLEETL